MTVLATSTELFRCAYVGLAVAGRRAGLARGVDLAAVFAFIPALNRS